MIIQDAVSAPIHTSIGAVASKFKIKASAKAFKILSGFYSEPILAIPRELGANAWDAHVKARNTKTNFIVHAPNSLEPWFSIRDFGTGLSPEDIDQIYTTYFESTKTSDNDSDGCMGLGSKTPFNYTENFSVTSYFQGTKYVYNCFIDEAGSPNILPVINEGTTEHNGMEIKFGVKITDISMFVEKVTRAYEPFRFRPTIVGANIVFQPREYTFEGNNWGLRKSGNRYDRGICRAFMGNYSYPISYDAVRGYITENIKGTDIRFHTLLSNGNFDFFFDIGDLEVAPNKEQLQYDADQKTAKAICDRVLIALKELGEQVNKQLEVPKTMWEAMSLYVKYNSYNGIYNNVRTIIGDIQIKYNNELVDSGNLSVDVVNKRTGMIPADATLDNQSKMMEKFSVGVLNYRSHSDKFVIRDRGYYSVGEKNEFPIFLYTNEENLKKARIRHFLKGKFPSADIPDSIIVVDKTPGFKAFKAHCKYLGVPDSTVVCIEDLPRPPRFPREPKTATTDEINFMDYSSVEVTSTSRCHNMYWDKKANTFDSKDTYYYIDFYYNDPVTPDDKKLENVGEMIRFLKSHKAIPETTKIIWGINKKNKYLLKVGTWINIYELAKKEIKKNQDKYEHNMYLLSLNDSLSRLSNVRRFIADGVLASNVTNKDTASKFKGLVKITKDIQEVPLDTPGICTLFDIKPKCHIPLPIDIKVFESEIERKYFGIFSMLDHYSSKIVQVAKLINFIDENS